MRWVAELARPAEVFKEPLARTDAFCSTPLLAAPPISCVALEARPAALLVAPVAEMKEFCTRPLLSAKPTCCLAVEARPAALFTRPLPRTSELSMRPLPDVWPMFCGALEARPAELLTAPLALAVLLMISPAMALAADRVRAARTANLMDFMVSFFLPSRVEGCRRERNCLPCPSVAAPVRTVQ